MTREEKAKAYDEALEQARKIHGEIANNELLGFPGQIEDIFPELRKEEKPLTSFQQCLNCILRGVYYAEVPDEKVNEFILNVVRTRTDELIKLAKKQEEQKHPDGCFTCDEYKKGYETGRLNGFTAGYNKTIKEQKPAEPTGKLSREEYLYQLLIDQLITYSDYEYLTGKKPAEWSDTNELVFKDICKHLKEEGYNGWVLLLNALRNGEFQPKQEQNDYITPHKEFFKFIYDRLINVHKENPNVDYMRSFKERLDNLSFEEKQEWSEEDEKTIDTIVSVLGQYIDYKAVSGIGSGYATPRYSKEIDWLKSLRPQPKVEWSEEDKKRYVSIRTTLETSAVLSKEDYDANVAWLRDLVNAIKYSGSKPSWKPSEDKDSKNSK